MSADWACALQLLQLHAVLSSPAAPSVCSSPSNHTHNTASKWAGAEQPYVSTGFSRHQLTTPTHLEL